MSDSIDPTATAEMIGEIDFDGDGRNEVLAEDRDGDGTVDAVLTDADGDDITDFGRFDTDHDGHLETVAVDADRDGDADVLLVDSDKDGYADTTKASIDEDFEPFSLDATSGGEGLDETDQTDETDESDAAESGDPETGSPEAAPFDVSAYETESDGDGAQTAEIPPSAAVDPAPIEPMPAQTAEGENVLSEWMDNTLSGLFR
ncbi:hypothetical protein [Pseudonocardia xishanensis]|uniref:EF hand domain-containing protein n=1 Tax=Pseudonocardia xishanensis TaxID=630995 RepID=A0ABP8RSR5_9PSEU